MANETIPETQDTSTTAKETASRGNAYIVFLVALSFAATVYLVWWSWGHRVAVTKSAPTTPLSWQVALLAGGLTVAAYILFPLLVAAIAKSKDSRTQKKTFPVRNTMKKA